MEQPKPPAIWSESMFRALEHYATKADLQAVKTDLAKEIGRLEVKIERMSWKILAAVVGGIVAALAAVLSAVLRFLVTA